MRTLFCAGAAIFSILFSVSAQDKSHGDSKAATGGARPPQMNQGFMGRDVPVFDPGSELMSYDGKLWNINNNRLFRARFEKFLNASAATDKSDVEYRETIDRILELLAPGNAKKQNIDAAFALLKKASNYKDDANLCRTMSDAVYAAQTSLSTVDRLKRENQILEKQRTSKEWNREMAAKTSSLGITTSAKDSDVAKENQKIERDARLATASRQLSDVAQTIENNKLRIAATELTTKGHLQALIMQYFATRRFEHVIIANRFYRAIYTDGDNSIEVYKKMVDSLPINKDAGQAKITGELNPQISASEGVMDQDAGVGGGAGGNGTNVNIYNGTPRTRTGSSFSAKGAKLGMENFGIESLTGGAAGAAQTISKLVSSLSQIDSLANEAIRDINEGVEAYKFLLEQGELQSATERLAETFALGEYMPSVRLLPREDKRRALEFSQKTNELLAALEVNDLTRAEKLVNEIQVIAKDFDTSKPLAKIETAKTISSMHLAKARNAAVSGDKSAMEAELRSAAEIWPRNPALSEVGTTIFNQSDVQQQAMNDFDRLLSQGNHRQIYNDKLRFIAASALYPEKQQQLTEVLQKMATVEGAILKAKEIAGRGDPAGAWESVEAAQKEFPSDTELNQLRATLTTQAADFVQTLNKAQTLEKQDQPGPALAWYLQARKKYPASTFARDGIDRMSAKVLPDAK
ncbi:MAG: hypothetical protein CAK90_05375 [Spartobacteria bacterium AMD-G4]|nr:MAG: hypothetical protein CAK90_05375 [Spartobacteria bacterium AMD-G4]